MKKGIFKSLFAGILTAGLSLGALTGCAEEGSLANEATSENEGYVNGVSNTSNDSVTNSDDLDYAVSNHKEGTVKENNSAIESDEGGI